VSGCIRFRTGDKEPGIAWLHGQTCQIYRGETSGFFNLSLTSGYFVTTDPIRSERKSQIDALLLKLPGASSRKINGLDAYFVSDKMFACISGEGIGLRLPAATARELQFSRNDVFPFQPGGAASTREWIQINCADVAGYEKDLPLFQSSLDFVKTGRM
jgi:hypothetical protein